MKKEERSHTIAGIARRVGVPDNNLVHLRLGSKETPIWPTPQYLKRSTIIAEFDRLLDEPDFIPDEPMCDLPDRPLTGIVVNESL